MKTTILTIALFVFALGTNAQDFYNKKYTLGNESGGKWYKLFDIDLNGNGNYNSVNIEVDINYVNTGIKYNSSAYIRLRENPDDSWANWQNNVTGLKQTVLKFKQTDLKTYELWAYSNGNYGHLSFECKVTKEASLIINIPEETELIPDVDLYEDVPNVGDWYYSTGDFIIDEGNVGIGTIDPSYKLEISDTSTDLSLLKLRNNEWACNQKTSIEFWNGRSKDHATSRIVSKMDGCGADGEALLFETQTAGETDPTTKMIIKNNGNVGIGTTTPGAKLHLKSGGQSLTFLNGNNTAGYTLNIGLNDDGVNFTNNVSTRGFNFSNQNGNLLKVSQTGDVGIGTTNTEGYKLAVAGNVIAEEVKVELQANWPDYVFDDNYELPSLQETENYIKQKGHLKDIPTAHEVQENGIDLGAMNAKLLQKIEELTLYTIDQQKQLKDLQKRLEQVETKN